MPDDDLRPTRTPTGLRTLDDKGKPPKSRLDDYQAAMTIVERLREGNEPRNAKASRIKAQIDGQPPFNPAKLITAGMRYYPNFNTLEAKAFISSALVPYYDLYASAPNYCEVVLDMADQREREYAGRVVTEELQRALCDTSWFELNIWKALYDYIAFGKGYVLWPDNATWRFRHVAWHRVWFPDQSDVDPDTWEYFVVQWHYDAHDLYRRVRNRERAEQAGWNVDNVIRAIQCAAIYDPITQDDWMGVQRQLRDHDLAADTQCEKIITAWLFVKEFDGKWSWFVLPLTRLMDPDGRKVPPEEHGFLYRRIGLYERPSQILAPFFFEVGDGSLNGLSGLGKDIFAPTQLKDRMACSKANNVFLRSSVLMQAQSGSARQKAALAQIGNVCVIPEGYAIQQSTILGDIESTIAVGRDLDMMLQSNTGIYRPQFEKPSGNPETATAATLRFQQGTVLSNSAVNRFHRQLDGCYAEMYRRIVRSREEDAAQFRRWCAERAVPEAALSKTRSVRSYRNVGNGSPFLRQTNIAALASFYAEFPEDGKRAFLEDVVAAYTSAGKVPRYVETRQASGLPTQDVWDATQENAALKGGVPVVWTPEQDDNVHLGVHAQALSQAMQGVQQGADPAAVAMFGQGVLQHAQAHLQALGRRQERPGTVQGGRKAQLKQWQQAYGQLGQQLAQVQKAAQQRQQQANQQRQQEAELTGDQRLDMMEMAGKQRLATMKTQHQMALREAQARQKLGIADAQSASKISRDNAAAAAAGNGEEAP